MKNKFWRMTAFAIFLLLFLATPVLAQSGELLLLSLNKSAGYNDFEGNIQGTFTLSVNEISGLERVEFFIDGTGMGWATAPPFKLKFDTGNYAAGVHTLSAIGYTSDGSEIHSNEIRTRFLTAQESRQKTLNIVIPIFGVVFGIILLSFVIPLVMGGRKRGQTQGVKPGSYGILGGVICPKCKRPFGMHFWGINLLSGRFDRCPHCGRWSVVRRATQEELKIAEEAETEMINAEDTNISHEAEEMHRDLDESRYIDG